MSPKCQRHHALELALGSSLSGDRAEVRRLFSLLSHFCVLSHCVSPLVPTFPTCIAGTRENLLPWDILGCM